MIPSFLYMGGLRDYRRVLAYVRPYRASLVLVVAVSLVSTGLSLAQPWIAKLLIDEALLRRNLNALTAVAALMVAVTVLGFVLGTLSNYRYVKLSAAMLFDLRLACFERLTALSPRFYAKTKLGEIVSRLNNDIGEIQRAATDSLLGLAASLLFLVGSIAMMLWIEWRLFLLSLCLLPLSALAAVRLQRQLTAKVKVLRERSAGIGAFLIEVLTGMRLVVASAAEKNEEARFRSLNAGFVNALLNMQLTSSLAGALPATILTLSTAAVFLYGGRMVIEGALSIGSLVAFMTYHLRLLAPVQSILGTWATLATARVSLDRVFELMDTRVEVCELPAARAISEVRGELVFEHVSLRHDRNIVLDDVSFRVAPGEICAIVGPSGVGKSTLADLAIRLLDPDSGAVLLDGINLRELRLADIRKSIGVVEQTPFLFHATLEENIAYAQPGATREQIIEAARCAAIHDFIASLPDGYNTIAGERGLSLSAGERQRIAIARAILRRPRVLVLDEPTAALDARTETDLASALASALEGRTALIITHRPSLAELATQQVRLEGGRVAEIRAAVPRA